MKNQIRERDAGKRKKKKKRVDKERKKIDILLQF
jgi:hypothetical protein